jgi:hypothetical protein
VQGVAGAGFADQGLKLGETPASRSNPRRPAIGARQTEGRRVKESGPTRPHIKKGPVMSDKSPRQSMTKKSGKSLKEKRAAKRAKAARNATTEALQNTEKR